MGDVENTIEGAFERAGLDPETGEAKVETPPVDDPPADDPPADDDPAAETPPADPPADAPPAEDPPADAPPDADDPIQSLADRVVEGLSKIAPAAVAPKPAAATPPAAPPEIKPPAHIAELIASEDEREQRLGKALEHDWRESRAEIAELRERLDTRDQTETEQGINAEMDEAAAAYALPGAGADGKPALQPIDRKDFDARVEKWVGDVNDPNNLRVPAVAAMSMEELLRVLYPEAVKRATPSARNGTPPGHDGPKGPVRRVPGSPRTTPAPILRGGGNAPPAQPKPSGERRPNEDSEAYLDRRFRELKID